MTTRADSEWERAQSLKATVDAAKKAAIDDAWRKRLMTAEELGEYNSLASMATLLPKKLEWRAVWPFLLQSALVSAGFLGIVMLHWHARNTWQASDADALLLLLPPLVVAMIAGMTSSVRRRRWLAEQYRDECDAALEAFEARVGYSARRRAAEREEAERDELSRDDRVNWHRRRSPRDMSVYRRR